MKELTTDQNDRYARNLLADGFTPTDQQRLLDAHVLVVGAGGLGSAALGYLAAAGVGHLRIVEYDTVSISNLQRQVLYTTPDLGHSKILCTQARLSALNPTIRIETVETRFTAENAFELTEGVLCVVDCSDNYAARHTIDTVTYQRRLPMIYGTAQDWTGQCSVFNGGRAKRYCDLYGEQMEQRPVVGVVSPIVGVMGALQAVECLKICLGRDTVLYNKLLTYNGITAEFRRFDL